MATVLGANTLASGGFQVNNSVRFNSADSADLRISDYSGAGTSRRIRTYSMWIKRSELSYAVIFGSAGKDHWVFNANNTIQFNIGSGTDSRRVTTRLFTDVTAWYHLVFAYDTTQGTAANRFTLWVNGVETSTAIVAGKNDVQQNEDALVFINGDTHTIGSDEDGASYCDCYMAEWVFVDGQKLDADSFGEFDEDSGIWKPIDVSAITLGTNGFYLDFQTASDLGIDAGNDNDFEPTNLAATDQTTDTCTNNFCTMNPLSSGMTLTEGNTNVAGAATAKSTFAVSSGKWYVEMKATNAQTYNPVVGIATASSSDSGDPGSSAHPGSFVESHGYDRSGVIKSNDNSAVQASLTTSQDDGDIIGLAIDLDSGTKTAQWYVNGSSVGSAVTLVSNDAYVFMTYASGSQAGTGAWNFGNPSYANSSSAADGNGFGDFEYAPPSGYLALCTKNLASTGG